MGAYLQGMITTKSPVSTGRSLWYKQNDTLQTMILYKNHAHHNNCNVFESLQKKKNIGFLSLYEVWTIWTDWTDFNNLSILFSILSGQRFRYTYYDENQGEIYRSIEHLDKMVNWFIIWISKYI